ncbi:MAG: sodium/proton antiporter, partial [Gemmatimonadota bacterium]
MHSTYADAFAGNFLGRSPAWYKRTILVFLVANPLIFLLGGSHAGFLAGWALVA